MTKEQHHRTVEALAETNTLIAKERCYLPQHQKAYYLASLEQHRTKLINMLTRVRSLNGIWLVEVDSPVAASGWIIQGVHRTYAAAEADRKTWVQP